MLVSLIENKNIPIMHNYFNQLSYRENLRFKKLIIPRLMISLIPLQLVMVIDISIHSNDWINYYSFNDS